MKTEKNKMKYYFVMALEQVWFARNQKWKGKIDSKWEDIERNVKINAIRHWRAGIERNKISTKVCLRPGSPHLLVFSNLTLIQLLKTVTLQLDVS